MGTRGINNDDYDLINILGQGQRAPTPQELFDQRVRQMQAMNRQMASTSTSNNFVISGGTIAPAPVEQKPETKHLNPKLLLTRKA